MKKTATRACAILLSLAVATPSFAGMGDAGSGPTAGATPTNDAGSGPTKGGAGMGKPNSDGSASNARHAAPNAAGATPGPSSTGGSQPVTPGMNSTNSK